MEEGLGRPGCLVFAFDNCSSSEKTMCTFTLIRICIEFRRWRGSRSLGSRSWPSPLLFVLRVRQVHLEEHFLLMRNCNNNNDTNDDNNNNNNNNNFNNNSKINIIVKNNNSK